MQRYLLAAVALAMLALAWVGVSFVRSGQTLTVANLVAVLPRQLGGKKGVGVEAAPQPGQQGGKDQPGAAAWVIFNTPDSSSGKAVWHARISARPASPTAPTVATLELGHALQDVFPAVLTLPGASASCPQTTRVSLQLDHAAAVTFKASGARNQKDCVLAVQVDENFNAAILNADQLTATAPEVSPAPVVFMVSGLSWPPL